MSVQIVQIRRAKSETNEDKSTATSGWTEWALSHPEFESSVNPIRTRGADYAHHITASPPGFENPAASLQCFCKCFFLDSHYHQANPPKNCTKESMLFLVSMGETGLSYDIFF